MLAQKAGHVGILGGTFNPIHYGHIELGVQALEQFRLDKVLVMPNNKPGYKDISNEVTTDHRVNMIKLAIDGIKGLEYSDFELRRPGITYTSDTLEALHELYPDVHWYFIMGGDLSSSDIRAAVRSGEDIRDMVPDSVITYIRDNGLYHV